jgi:hypothetical protein
LPGTREKIFSLHFKCYNSTNREINFFETFCTRIPSGPGQDLIVKIPIFYFLFLFGLLELEMADLIIF